jgi:hypothetical protein
MKYPPPELWPDGATSMFVDDDGTVTYGDEANAAALRHGLAAQEQHRRAVEALTPLQLHVYQQRLRTGRWPVSPSKQVDTVSAPRRTNGSSGRPSAQASRSSAKSGDSGDDSDPEPPAAERWRWASEASWRSFVKSIASRDFEREIALERWPR